MVMPAYNLSVGSIKQEDCEPRGPEQKGPLFRIALAFNPSRITAKKGWRCVRVPVLQMQSPEIKFQYPQN
jgi:hypothetical protein